MAFDNEKCTARSLLGEIEDGTLDASDTYDILENEDPTLVYLVFRWIRANYPHSHPAADAVIGRLADLCSTFPAAAKKAAKGKNDPIVDWFEDAFEYRDYRANEFIDLIVEKLEG